MEGKGPSAASEIAQPGGPPPPKGNTVTVLNRAVREGFSPTRSAAAE